LIEASVGDDGVIEREMRNIDRQDALDALGVPSEDALDALTDIDEDWEAIEKDASAWIEQTLQFIRLREISETESIKGAIPFRYIYSTSRMHTLIPLETFYSNCISSIDMSKAALLSRTVKTVPMTFRRRTALSRSGRASSTRLLRYGDPFISGMWSITQGDDRGRSTAMWRQMPGYHSDAIVDLFFRFDYVIEADVSAAVNVMIEAALGGPSAAAAARRRGDMALPPFQQTIWLDREMELVTDATLLALLNRPYQPKAAPQGGRDFNLNPKRWLNMMRLDIPEQENWNDLCVTARQKSEACLLTLPSFVGDLEEAERRASEVDIGRLGQLHARAVRSADPADKADWVLESKLSQHLIAGIKAPHIHLDSILASFVTGNAAASAIIDDRA
ncbi:hypothetical protein, partial [Sneathiella sp.]|uniref:hypothetical protein n=1 Tax=Sneathiella sp. TaxID=1964365 RepID=UPI003569D60B